MKIIKTRLFVKTDDALYKISFSPNGQISIWEKIGNNHKGKPIWSEAANDIYILNDAILDFGFDYKDFINQASQRYQSYY